MGDRAVRRRQDDQDARVVRVELTDEGDHLVTELTQAHLAELRKLATALAELLPGRPDETGPSQ